MFTRNEKKMPVLCLCLSSPSKRAQKTIVVMASHYLLVTSCQENDKYLVQRIAVHYGIVKLETICLRCSLFLMYPRLFLLRYQH